MGYPNFFEHTQSSHLFPLPRLVVFGVSESLHLAFLSSALPVVTAPSTAILYSLRPCLLHFCFSFTSLCVWIAAVLFIRFRFQLSIDTRRNGLWFPTTLGTISANTHTSDGEKSHKKDSNGVCSVSDWVPGHVYNSGDVVRGVGSNILLKLISYCSYGSKLPRGTIILPDFMFRMMSPLQHRVIFSWEQAIFETISAEVGPLESSRIIDGIFLCSSFIAALASMLMYVSDKVHINCTIISVNLNVSP